MLSSQIPAIQKALAAMGADGWFFACFQHNDPVSRELLGIDDRHVTRRCYYVIPLEGEPRKLNHALEPWMLDHLPGEKSLYLSWQEHAAALAAFVDGHSRLAAQYSPNNQLPSVSRLDLGTAELLRSNGVELVSSADLVQRFAATWSREQLEGHRRACRHLHDIVKAAFAEVSDALRSGRAIDELAVQRFIVERFGECGLTYDSGPIVAVNAHAADPHYAPTPDSTSPIAKGDFLLIDLFAKDRHPGSVYADITWCGVCAASPTDRQQEVWQAAVNARDAAIRLVRERFPAETVRGFEVDDACRAVIVAAGFGEYFIHRTGHSIGIEDHGQGANMDNLETHDTRPLIPMTGFSIEPGIYFPGDFGVRTEVNVALTEDAAEVTGAEPQKDLLRRLD